MVAFSEVAVFVLATSQGKQQGRIFSQWERRLLPLAETWGSSFPQLYGVMGRNQYDLDFLEAYCTLGETWVTGSGKEGDEYTKWTKAAKRRQLIAHEAQGPYKDTADIWNCTTASSQDSTRHFHGPARPSPLPPPTGEAEEGGEDTALSTSSSSSSSSPSSSPPSSSSSSPPSPLSVLIQVIMTHRCTGEYFGSGPTCRAQEVMLAYLHVPAFRQSKYFIFIDDDVYIRPHAMLRFLSVTQTMAAPPPSDTAFLVNRNVRGFGYARRKVVGHNCSNPDVHGFYFAQPAVLTRAAVERMGPSLQRRGMDRLQRYWGGSHDAILGMFIYLHRLPVWSLAESYNGNALQHAGYEGTHTTGILRYVALDRVFIFHKVRNQRLKPSEPKRLISHSELFRTLRDGAKTGAHVAKEEAVGEAAARLTLAMPISDTSRLKLFNPDLPEAMEKAQC